MIVADREFTTIKSIKMYEDNDVSVSQLKTA